MWSFADPEKFPSSRKKSMSSKYRPFSGNTSHSQPHFWKFTTVREFSCLSPYRDPTFHPDVDGQIRIQTGDHRDELSLRFPLENFPADPPRFPKSPDGRFSLPWVIKIKHISHCRSSLEFKTFPKFWNVPICGFGSSPHPTFKGKMKGDHTEIGADPWICPGLS